MRALHLLSFVMACAALAGCVDRTDGHKPLRVVTLPDLSDFPEDVRVQLSDQHRLLQDMMIRGVADRGRLGDGYGTLGQLLLAYGLHRAAEPALLNATDLQPDDIRWRYFLGYKYKTDAKLEPAARQFEIALAADAEHVPSHIQLAEVYVELGREDDAKGLLYEAIRLDPNNAAAYYLLANLAGPDETAAAIEYYETVLRLQPAASVVHYPLGLAYQKQGDLERSRQHMARRGDTYIAVNDPLLNSLQLVKKGPESAMFRASGLMEQRQYREAAAAFAEVVAEDPTNAAAYLNLGVAHAQLGNASEAVQALERAILLDPTNSRAHYNLGLLFLRKGENERALEHFRRAVAGDPNNNNAHLALSSLLWHEGRCGEAIPHFEKFLEANPGHVDVRINQALCHIQLNDYTSALGLLEAGHEALPQEPKLQDALVRVLAASPDASVRDGIRALELAQPLAEAFPRPETVEGLAMALAEVGRFPEAVEHQMKVIQVAEGQGLPVILEFLRSNLELYQQGKPCRLPWPPAVLRGI